MQESYLLNNKHTIKSVEELKLISSFLRDQLIFPSLLLLNGDLGAGKTTFIQQLSKEFGYEGKVNSPTFTRIHEYQCKDITVFHLDIYRELPTYQELEEVLMEDNSIVCIEWANKLKDDSELKEIYELSDRQVIEMNFMLFDDGTREIDIRILNNDFS